MPAPATLKWRAKPMQLLRLALLLTVLALAACAASPPTSNRPLIAPTVACDENIPFEPLPDLPVAPDVESADQLAARHASAADYAVAYGQLYAYALRSLGWGSNVAGVFERNRIKRETTARCITDLRRRGVIY